MKSKTILYLVLTMLFSPSTFAQQSYQRLHGITESDYSIKAELQLDFTYSIIISGDNAFSQSGILHFKSPSFLKFNRNDLLFFQNEPDEFIDTPLNIDTDCCFSESGSKKEVVAGYTTITEDVLTHQDGVSSEIKLKGEQLSSVKIVFLLYDLRNKVKSGEKDFQFRLEFSHDVCPDCLQKDVTGYIQYENLKITDNVRLDGRIISSIRFQEYLNQAIADNVVATKDDRTQWVFKDAFADNYYKDMPRISSDSLIEFLLNPNGVIEFPLSGFLNSPDGIEKITYKGSLKLDGERVYKYWNGN